MLVRWYQYTHPDVAVPTRLLAGALRDRIWSEAAWRLRVTYYACSPATAKRIERHIIRYGMPGTAVPPMLNSPNWRPPAASAGRGADRTSRGSIQIAEAARLQDRSQAAEQRQQI